MRENHTVVVFPEEQTTDTDGNPVTRPSTVGIPARAVVQPLGTTTDDQDATGAVTGPTRYRLRLADSWSWPRLGRQSAVEWDGHRYSVIGDPLVYNGSRKTRRVEYTIGRA